MGVRGQGAYRLLGTCHRHAGVRQVTSVAGPYAFHGWSALEHDPYLSESTGLEGSTWWENKQIFLKDIFVEHLATTGVNCKI